MGQCDTSIIFHCFPCNKPFEDLKAAFRYYEANHQANCTACNIHCTDENLIIIQSKTSNSLCAKSGRYEAVEEIVIQTETCACFKCLVLTFNIFFHLVTQLFPVNNVSEDTAGSLSHNKQKTTSVSVSNTPMMNGHKESDSVTTKSGLALIEIVAEIPSSEATGMSAPRFRTRTEWWRNQRRKLR